MKYKHTSSRHVHWANEMNCAKFLDYITAKLLGGILKESKYIIGSFNLIKNDGMVDLDQ